MQYMGMGAYPWSGVGACMPGTLLYTRIFQYVMAMATCLYCRQDFIANSFYKLGRSNYHEFSIYGKIYNQHQEEISTKSY